MSTQKDINMKVIPFVTLFTFLSLSLKSQKRNLELDSYKNWSSINQGAISDDGQYVWYQVAYQSTNDITTILTDTNKEWETKLHSLSQPAFSESSELFSGQIKDTLLLLSLESKKVKKIPDISEYRILKLGGKTMLIYKKKTNGLLNIVDTNGDILKAIGPISSFTVSPNKELIAVIKDDSSQKNIKTLSIVNLKTLTEKNIYSGVGCHSLIFNGLSSELAFMATNGSNTSIWYYKTKDENATQLLDNRSVGLDTSLVLEPGSWTFSPDGKQLLFGQREKSRAAALASNPEIWNFQDLYLLSLFKGSFSPPIPNFRPRSYPTIVNISDRKIKRLLNEGEIPEEYSFANKKSPIFFYYTDVIFDINATEQKKYSLGVCNVQTGQKRIIFDNQSAPLLRLNFSPNQTHFVYYKTSDKQFYSYNLNTNLTTCISCSINDPLLDAKLSSYPIPERSPSTIVGWVNTGNRVLISDSYDIWSFDINGKDKPVNITNGYGKKNNIIFFPAENCVSAKDANPYNYVENQEVVLKAFNQDNKEFGYYKVYLGKPNTLEKLSMSPFAIGRFMFNYKQLNKNDFVESNSKKGYLLRLESMNSAPNYYYSKDLRTFKKLSDIEPQKDYNWLKKVLYTFTDSSGVKYQGLLYKPENFDSTKSYPLIVYYYDQFSNELNSFTDLELGKGNIDIPYMVSNGYMIFRPDMKTVAGKPGEGMLSTINNSIDVLCKEPWINKKKIAFVGESFGGWETNYLVTHIKRPITAAISGAGISDLVSLAFTPSRNGGDLLGYIQMGPIKLGKSFSDDPNLYIEYSPLYQAKNMNTPLLLWHNPEDKQVPMYQSIAFFIQLRNLGKPVWLISYKGEDHGIANPDNALDQKKKVNSFLDYYLKDKEQPKWMENRITSID